MDQFLLMLTSFATAAVSGTIGFGGAILLLPVLTASVGVAKAVPILTFIQIVGNASRVAFARTEINWSAVKGYLVTGVPFAILGAYSFVAVPKTLMLHIVGFAILAFIALKFLGLTKGQISNKGLPVAGAIIGFLSGFIGTAGPLGAAVLMSMNMPPLTYIATDAFCSLVMHTAKAFVYGVNNAEFASISALTIAMSITTIIGTFVGNKIAKKLPQNVFRAAVTTLIVVAAVQMILAT